MTCDCNKCCRAERDALLLKSPTHSATNVENLLKALRYCADDDPYAVDPFHKVDVHSANEWKKMRARETLEMWEICSGTPSAETIPEEKGETR